jgi:hypothetical protein
MDELWMAPPGPGALAESGTGDDEGEGVGGVDRERV